MPWWRVVGAAGRMMIRAGVLLLLFVAYQLWGTGLATSRAQESLANKFETLQRTAPTVTDPATAPTDLPIPEPGDPIGRIQIPRIDVDFIMVQSVDLRYLQNGPGHFPQTPLPGQPGNSAFAGHRTTYKAPFNRIDELAPGDVITVTTLQGTFTYVVDRHVGEDGTLDSGHFIVKPTDLSILDQDKGNRLTLMACNPKYSAATRIVVTATLTTPAAPATARPDTSNTVTDNAALDSLANGDPGAWPAAILWSLLVLAVWVGTWWLARRWRRLPAYAIGTPVVLVLLFLAFQNIARLLPAGI
ncbi:MAG: class E sortase [Acidobacteria bacterium]|nr:class E sortase [Acidobacteriota bacterium]